MCLTETAYKDRYWGPHVTLRKLLEGRKTPDYYFGHSSSSDNIFAAVSRHLELSTLVKENKSAITDAVKTAILNNDERQIDDLIHELNTLKSMLLETIRCFKNECREVESLTAEVHKIVEPYYREKDKKLHDDIVNKRSSKTFQISVTNNNFMSAMVTIEKMVKKLKPCDLNATYSGKSMAALKKTNKVTKEFDMKFQLNGEMLNLVTSFTTIAIPATGTADVTVILPGHILMQMHDTFKNKEKLNFNLSGSSFKIDTLSLPCTVMQ